MVRNEREVSSAGFNHGYTGMDTDKNFPHPLAPLPDELPPNQLKKARLSAGLERIKQRQGLLMRSKPRLPDAGVVVDGPERPLVSVDHGPAGLVAVCKENVGPAAPVQVTVSVLPLLVIEVITMSATNARVVMAWP